MKELNRLGALLALAGLLAVTGCASKGNTTAEGPTSRTLDAQQIEILMNGHGAGQALVAEINGYPGPKHVLQHSEELGITPDQRFELTRLLSVTQGKARAMGSHLIKAEHELDRFLAEGVRKMSDVRARLDEISAIRAALRSTHIEAHLKTRSLLSEGQLKRYAELRGLPANPFVNPAEPEKEEPVAQTPLY